MEKSDQNKQRKKKKQTKIGEENKGFWGKKNEEKKLLSGQVVIEKLPVFHSRQ